MINSQDFKTELVELCEWFKKDLTAANSAMLYEILSEVLDTPEFSVACKNAKRSLQSHPSFFPSPQWLIDSALGTIEERARLELDDLAKLSPVGRKALDAIGGALEYKNSTTPQFVRKAFIEEYAALARNASPAALRRRETPLTATVSEPPKQDLTKPRQTKVTLGDKLGILRCHSNFPDRRPQAHAEAARYGFRVDRGYNTPENQRITLSPGQNPNEEIEMSPQELEKDARSLTGGLAGNFQRLEPLGF